MNRLCIIAAILYAIAGALAFGHAWTRASFGFESKPDSEMRLMGSFGCACAWPLYLAVVIWEKPPQSVQIESNSIQPLQIKQASLVAFNAAPSCGYYSIATKEKPSWFHRFMMRFFFGFEWTG